jgi:hypothetical protein
MFVCGIVRARVIPHRDKNKWLGLSTFVAYTDEVVGSSPIPPMDLPPAVDQFMGQFPLVILRRLPRSVVSP